MSRAWIVREQSDCFMKIFDQDLEGQSAFFKEIYFYRNFSGFAPALLAVDHLTLYIEKCEPVISSRGKYKGNAHEDSLELYGRLMALGRHGGQHGDVNLINVVRHPTRGLLLIDWEKATLQRGISRDLFPNPPLDPIRKQLVCWDGPWMYCPGIIFDISAKDMDLRYSAEYQP